MAEKMKRNDHIESLPPEQVKRGRRTALLLFAIGFGPMIMATVMFYTGWMNPTDQSNLGELINPPVPLSQVQFQGANGEPLADRFGPDHPNAEWMMVVVAGDCLETCEELLYQVRQVNIALGKNADRMNRSAWLGSESDNLASRWSTEYQSMEKLSLIDGATPAWPTAVDPSVEPRILLVDPFGNVIMHYGSEHTGKDMLKDLKHLLKLSQIG